MKAAKKRILLFDGAMGTEIQRLDPRPEDFPDRKDGFNDGLTLSRSDWIKKIHRGYLKAGADCIETNTFGSNKFKLDEYGYGDNTVEFNKERPNLQGKYVMSSRRVDHDMSLALWGPLDIYQPQMTLHSEKSRLMTYRRHLCYRLRASFLAE